MMTNTAHRTETNAGHPSRAAAVLSIATLVCAALLSSPLHAQTPGNGGAPAVQEEVLDVVQGLFDAIEERDTDRAAELLHPDGQFFRVPLPFEELPPPAPHEEFVQSLAEPGPDLLERMENPEVQVHERLASAWTPYEFYAGGEFSHCGVNAFHLVRDDAGWRIVGIVYTVEPDPDACLEGLGPPDG